MGHNSNQVPKWTTKLRTLFHLFLELFNLLGAFFKLASSFIESLFPLVDYLLSFHALLFHLSYFSVPPLSRILPLLNLFLPPPNRLLMLPHSLLTIPDGALHLPNPLIRSLNRLLSSLQSEPHVGLGLLGGL